MTNRLDNFTDAAFAFALTLLVIGGSEAPTSYRALAGAVAEVPTFAIGFAIIAIFWVTHLRWRVFRGDGDWLSALLTLLLVFLVLIYVQPLRAMARSLSHFIGSGVAPFEGDLGNLFVIYGAGFVAMAEVTAALFAEAARRQPPDPELRLAVRGEMLIWIILTLTGMVSVALAAFNSTERIAPWLYTSLPITIGLFVWRYDWEGRTVAAPAGQGGD